MDWDPNPLHTIMSSLSSENSWKRWTSLNKFSLNTFLISKYFEMNFLWNSIYISSEQNLGCIKYNQVVELHPIFMTFEMTIDFGQHSYHFTSTFKETHEYTGIEQCMIFCIHYPSVILIIYFDHINLRSINKPTH